MFRWNGMFLPSPGRLVIAAGALFAALSLAVRGSDSRGTVSLTGGDPGLLKITPVDRVFTVDNLRARLTCALRPAPPRMGAGRSAFAIDTTVSAIRSG